MQGILINKKIQIILVVYFAFCATPLWADWNVEAAKINFLFAEMGQVDGAFIRNGSEYPPEEALAHLKMKMENAMGSWFSPKKEKWTAEMFINKIASKSSISGKPYQILFKDGKTVHAKEWLYERLKSFQQSQ